MAIALPYVYHWPAKILVVRLFATKVITWSIPKRYTNASRLWERQLLPGGVWKL
jgi:hypothetical protein